MATTRPSRIPSIHLLPLSIPPFAKLVCQICNLPLPIKHFTIIQHEREIIIDLFIRRIPPPLQIGLDRS